MKIDCRKRIIIDTNVVVSAVLFSNSPAREALVVALNNYTVVFAQKTWDELAYVLQRPKFDKYIALAQRLHFLADFARKITVVDSRSVVTDCRDPKDNKFLALALDAGACTIVTGDKDLLVLNPFNGISINTPVEFLANVNCL